jgi:hypothetical protein
MPVPRLACDCEELIPIVLVPHRSLPRLADQDALALTHQMREQLVRSLTIAIAYLKGPEGLYFGIRHNPAGVHLRLRIVTGALRKRDYRVGMGSCTEGERVVFRFELFRKARISFHVKQTGKRLCTLLLRRFYGATVRPGLPLLANHCARLLYWRIEKRIRRTGIHVETRHRRSLP